MLERYFQLRAHGTTVKTEVLAGLTTFLTMAYIIVVNPAILEAAGKDKGDVKILAVTVLAVNILGDGLRDTLDPKMAKRV